MAETLKEMTAAQAAKLVKRPVNTTEPTGTKDDLGEEIMKKTTKRVAVSEDEVLSFKDYGGHVVVVTKDGQKFSSAD